MSLSKHRSHSNAIVQMVQWLSSVTSKQCQMYAPVRILPGPFFFQLFFSLPVMLRKLVYMYLSFLTGFKYIAKATLQSTATATISILLTQYNCGTIANGLLYGRYRLMQATLQLSTVYVRIQQQYEQIFFHLGCGQSSCEKEKNRQNLYPSNTICTNAMDDPYRIILTQYCIEQQPINQIQQYSTSITNLIQMLFSLFQRYFFLLRMRLVFL